MKITSLLTIPLLLSFTPLSVAQTATPNKLEVSEEKLNPLEKNFLKHFDKLAPEFLKAIGEPAEILPRMRIEVIKGLNQDKALALTDKELQLIKSNGEVEGYLKAVKFWNSIHTKFSAPEMKGNRQAAPMLLIASHIKSFGNNASTVDKLLAVKAAEKMQEQMTMRNRMRNMMHARQISLILRDAENNQVAPQIPAKLKFTNDDGKKLDWVTLTKAENKLVQLHSPMTTGGKYVILLRDGAIVMETPAVAKAKYGIGK